MNRILATTLLAALAFTGCMKDNSEEYKKQQQVIPGVDIYSSAMVQQNVSTQMAEAGLRLASLLAEAKVQYPDTPLEEVDLSKIEVKVWDDTRPLQLLLFGSGTQIAREGADSWRITYPDGLLQTDGFMLEGSLVVNTNGTELLSDATFSTPWQVVMQPDFKIKANTTDGLGNSRQKYLYVPEPQNDFIFSILCEELGFIGAVLVVALFLLLLLRGMSIAVRARDKFGALLVVGFVVQVTLQAILNMAVVTNTIPNTGISLPFFSSGGTSLLMLLGEMGIVLSVSRQTDMV